jgi:Dyp-type peroxidase family
MDSDQLQDGVYFRSGERPAPCYRLLPLDAVDGANGMDVRDALQRMLAMLAGLKGGEVRELRGQDARGNDRTRDLYQSLRVLAGFGRRLFDSEVHQPALVVAPRPDHLSYLPRTGRAFPGIPWLHDTGETNLGEADVVLQLTADSDAATNCAAVEIWKLIIDEHLPLAVRTSFSGFSRPDGRGWLEFHDGLSNIEPSQREQVLIAGDDPPWMAGGTYMAVLRFVVDLSAWRSLSPTEQELLVGRSKLNGAPLVAVARGPDGAAIPVAATVLNEAPDAPLPADFREPAPSSDPLLAASHLRRANRNGVSAFAPSGLRLYRQGYEFLDALNADGPRLGLNFVSFQQDLSVLHHVLNLPDWLGDVNFGGPSPGRAGDPPALEFVRLQAGGLYAVPPKGDPFPGADVFRSG